MNNVNESGRSMMEMLGVIAIISVITIGAITAVGISNAMYRATLTQAEVEDIVRGVQDLYSWYPDYSRLTANQICQNDILRDCDSSSSSGMWKNAWGGEISVTSANGGESFNVTYTQVSKRACTRLQSMSWVFAQIKSANCETGLMVFEPKQYTQE